MKMKKMNYLKNAILSTLLVMAIAVAPAYAQDEGEITDEELATYAMVMDSIDVMKQKIQDDLNAMIQSEETMKGGRRYLEIQKAAGDPEKLAELEVTEEEQMVYDNIQAKYEEMTANFKESYTKLIQDRLGGTLYNDITKALRDNGEVKERYDAISARQKESKGTDTDTAGTEIEG